jgi:hypothetical protein
LAHYGIESCQNSVRIPQAALEERVLGGLEARFLTPENVEYVVEQAVRIVQEERSDDRTRRDEQRMFQLEGEIDNLIELAQPMALVRSCRRHSQTANERSPRSSLS